MNNLNDVWQKYSIPKTILPVTIHICEKYKMVFGNFYKYFLNYYETRLIDILEKNSFRYGIKFESNVLLNSLISTLFEDISALSIRTLIVELNEQKENCHLNGDTSAKRYDDFNDKLTSKVYLETLFSKYPVLLYLIDRKIHQSILLIETCLQNFGKDQKQIEDIFLVSVDKISQITITSGDSHNNGKKVIILSLGNKKIVYKPHSLSNEKMVNQIFDYLNRVKSTKRFSFQPLKCIDCTKYGWQEFVSHSEAITVQDQYAFFYRTGGWICILYMFSASDIHYENIIASINTPRLIDLETLVHILPHQKEIANSLTEAVNQDISHSVLGTMYLPLNFEDDLFDINLSGLGGAEVTSSDKWLYYSISNVGTDEIRLEKKHFVQEETSNILFFKGEKQFAKKNINDILEGFRDCYEMIWKNKNEVYSIINENSLLIRHVLKPTAIYGKYIEASSYPTYLTSFQSMNKLFHKLNTSEVSEAYQEYEVNALLNHDIPYFSSLSDSKDLIANECNIINNFFNISALELIKKNLGKLSKSDLIKQEYYIGQSISTLNEQTKPWKKNYQLTIANNYLQNAKQIADSIRNNIISYKNSENMTLLMAHEGLKKSFLGTINMDLYTGGGIILFLALLGRELNDSSYIKVAEKLAASNREQNLHKNNLSAFSGIGSVIYIHYNLYKLTNNQIYLENCLDDLKNIEANKQYTYDFATGISGLLIFLLNIYEKENENIWLEKATFFGSKLYMYVTSNEFKVLTGLAHGNSGCAWALYKLGNVLDEEKYIIKARELLIEENQYFNGDMKNWIDLRDKKSYLSYWCYGAPGIVLSRINMGDMDEMNLIKEDIERSLDTILNSKCSSSTLCHGSFGNLDILLEVSKIEKYKFLTKDIQRLAINETKKIMKQGIVFGNSQFINDYSFMQGLSGIGYSFLRLFNSDIISVLSLEVL